MDFGAYASVLQGTIAAFGNRTIHTYHTEGAGEISTTTEHS
jgi:urease alpha subunit